MREMMKGQIQQQTTGDTERMFPKSGKWRTVANQREVSPSLDSSFKSQSPNSKYSPKRVSRPICIEEIQAEKERFYKLFHQQSEPVKKHSQRNLDGKSVERSAIANKIQKAISINAGNIYRRKLQFDNFLHSNTKHHLNTGKSIQNFKDLLTEFDQFRQSVLKELKIQEEMLFGAIKEINELVQIKTDQIIANQQKIERNQSTAPKKDFELSLRSDNSSFSLIKKPEVTSKSHLKKTDCLDSSKNGSVSPFAKARMQKFLTAVNSMRIGLGMEEIHTSMDDYGRSDIDIERFRTLNKDSRRIQMERQAGSPQQNSHRWVEVQSKTNRHDISFR